MARRSFARACLALTLGCAASASAQGVTTRGTDFWAVDLENMDGGETPDFGIVVMNGQPTEVQVRVEGSTGLLASATVTGGTEHVFRFDRTRMMLGTQVAPNAYHVVASAPVTVYQFNPLVDAMITNDASTLLPVQSLGTTYRPFSRQYDIVPDPLYWALPGLVAIVGVSVQPTNVTIFPNGLVLGGGLSGCPAAPVCVTLNQFDVLQLMTDFFPDSDLTGSLVTSDRPIAVFGGHRCAYVPVGVFACQHLEEQAFPVTAWGKDYLLVKSSVRGAEPDLWRIIAAEDDTIVTLTPPLIPSPVTLMAGLYLEIETAEDVHVVASKPVEVGQYLEGGNVAGGALGDPSLILVVPTEQFDDRFLFWTPEFYLQDFVTLVRPAGASVDLDGAAVPDASFRPIGVTGFERAWVPVSEGGHRIEASAGIGVYAYGYDGYSAYGYHAGAKLDSINSPLACDAGGPYAACGTGSVLLDATRSSGPGPLNYLWSSFSPGVTFASPTSVATTATLAGTGPWAVSLTLTSGTDSVSCFVDVTNVAPSQPPGLSESTGRWLHVARVPDDPAWLTIAFELPASAPEELVNLYAGTIGRNGIVAYDHVPLACHARAERSRPPMASLDAPLDAGRSHYFLVSASNCLGEGTRGFRSDGIERPVLASDCGPLR